MIIFNINTIGNFLLSNKKEEDYEQYIEYDLLNSNKYIAKLSSNCSQLDKIESIEYYIKNNLINKNDIKLLIELLKVNNKNYIFISSLSEFINELKKIKDEDNTYYRGVSYFGYNTIPSLFHNEKYVINEEKLYKEFYARFPSVFKDKSRLDILATMQHYGLPTRLLDDTENPLVALYMAVNNVFNEEWSKDLPGEVLLFHAEDQYIKYFDSESVLILSSLPLISYKSKLELKKLLKQNNNLTLLDLKESNFELYLEFSRIMRKADPNFDDGTKLNVLLNSYFVKSASINDRIIAQSGGFILCGLDENVVENKFRNKTKRLFIINKNEILKELAKVNISDETMLRDLDHVARYLKEIYSK